MDTKDAKKRGHAVLSICVKCSDLYSHTIYKQDGTTVEYSGYVPSFFPEEHYGDYVMLDINPYTGKILNWKPWKRAKAKRLE
jgi:hypothetical protein